MAVMDPTLFNQPPEEAPTGQTQNQAPPDEVQNATTQTEPRTEESAARRGGNNTSAPPRPPQTGKATVRFTTTDRRDWRGRVINGNTDGEVDGERAGESDIAKEGALVAVEAEKRRGTEATAYWGYREKQPHPVMVVAIALLVIIVLWFFGRGIITQNARADIFEPIGRITKDVQETFLSGYHGKPVTVPGETAPPSSSGTLLEKVEKRTPTNPVVPDGTNIFAAPPGKR